MTQLLSNSRTTLLAAGRSAAGAQAAVTAQAADGGKGWLLRLLLPSSPSQSQAHLLGSTAAPLTGTPWSPPHTGSLLRAVIFAPALVTRACAPQSSHPAAPAAEWLEIRGGGKDAYYGMQVHIPPHLLFPFPGAPRTLLRVQWEGRANTVPPWGVTPSTPGFGHILQPLSPLASAGPRPWPREMSLPCLSCPLSFLLPSAGSELRAPVRAEPQQPSRPRLTRLKSNSFPETTEQPVPSQPTALGSARGFPGQSG